MNASSAIQFGRLQEPEVVTCEMAEGHRVPKEVLFEGTLMVIKGILLLFKMLLYKSLPIVVKVLKDKGLI